MEGEGGGMKIVYNKKLWMICFLWILAGLLYAQNAKPGLQILDYYVDYNSSCIGEAGIVVHFLEYQFSNLKDHSVTVSFALKQHGEWLPGTRVNLEGEIEIPYAETLYTLEEPDSLWFCYPHTQLDTTGVILTQPIEGYLIVSEKSGKSQKDVAMAKIDLLIINESEVLDGMGAVMETDLSSIIIEYAEALGDRIEIKNKTLYYSAQTGYYGDTQGPSANFAPTRTTREQRLSEVDLQELLDVFYANTFHDLEDGYGANPEDRYYPETLRLVDGWGDKTVVYRSNPNVKARPKPKEFDLIVNAIVALKDKYFKN
jgi:hypothetical protein